jgi:hypothetical protein
VKFKVPKEKSKKRWLSSGMQHHVVWLVLTDVSEELSAFITQAGLVLNTLNCIQYILIYYSSSGRVYFYRILKTVGISFVISVKTDFDDSGQKLDAF